MILPRPIPSIFGSGVSGENSSRLTRPCTVHVPSPEATVEIIISTPAWKGWKGWRGDGEHRSSAREFSGRTPPKASLSLAIRHASDQGRRETRLGLGLDKRWTNAG